MKRRDFLKTCFSFLVKGALLSTTGYMYAKYVEPRRLTVRQYDIVHPLIPKQFDGCRLLQFSDVHAGYHDTVEQFQRIVTKINDLAPHVICFTGDLLDEPNKYEHVDTMTALLQQLDAPLGKFCIYGNHDHGGYGTDIYKEMMEKSGFRLLVNEWVAIKQGSEQIVIAGLDDFMLGKPNFSKTVQRMPKNTYTIVLIHEPDLATQASAYPFHLQLSGHSHGGQIQLPWIGPIVTPPLAKQYIEGFYDVGPLTLYVNRGLGTTRMPFRFLTPPELTLFTLKAGS
ncbi:metallophosphoesterase [Anoxybacillus sp. ST4]|uniref:metallophosphoesterase n=1 Tax=Anoxybacillus sp. ST4 TaxID=2864181 RepID=UPI001C6403F5|nr:metallophosphoesterase [Anoxybacillus sp. ST4]MBW7651067.1 metallophosphoesterase [Anoxybacillus sp. ST4]